MDSHTPHTMDRALQLIARLRDLQLRAAMRGRVRVSMRYAARAQRIRRAIAQEPELAVA